MEQTAQFNAVDLVVLALILIGIVRGFIKGLSGELADLIGAAVSATAGFTLFRSFAEYLVNASRLSLEAAYPIAFAAITLGAYALTRILRFLLRHMMEFSFKGRLERLGGAFVGGLSVAIAAIVFVFVMGLLPIGGLGRMFKDSFLGRTVCVALNPVYESLSEKYPALQIEPKDEPPAEGETPKDTPQNTRSETEDRL